MGRPPSHPIGVDVPRDEDGTAVDFAVNDPWQTIGEVPGEIVIEAEPVPNVLSALWHCSVHGVLTDGAINLRPLGQSTCKVVTENLTICHEPVAVWARRA